MRAQNNKSITKLALCLIVKGADEEAEALTQCLRHAILGVDDVFITITHKPGEEINQAVKEVAEFYNAHISTFEWCNDFAKARNFNFAQVPKDFTHIFWLDADDAPRGVENLKDTIDAHPEVDCFVMFYLYAFDEQKNPIVVHQKVRVVKNDDSTTWVGRIHEDFKDNRTLTTFFVKGIEILHLTDEERVKRSSERNLEIAKEMAAELPDDPRSYWNLGNALKAAGKNTEALDALNKFIESSNSDDEKYVAYIRKAESLFVLGRKQEAIDAARFALGMKPLYPDAYHFLGTLYFENHQYDKAKEMYLMGLTMKPPYYSIVVYNPRDYDYTPLMNLAKTYFNLALPGPALDCVKACQKIYPKDKNLKNLEKMLEKENEKFEKILKVVQKLNKIKDKEKLRKEIDKLPVDVKSHPGVCNLRNINFIKEESSGKDLVFFCGYSWEEWTPETAQTKGIGGSEEAIIHLSEMLAQKGWNVTVYNNCGHMEQKFGGVTYKPFWSFNYRDKQDVVVIWRVPKYLDWDINATKVYLDMHDVLPAGEMTPSRIEKVTKVFVKSTYQRSLWPNVPDEKFVVVPNGILPEVFDQEVERDPMLVINTSAPNRGIAVLTEMWEMVKLSVPEARLQWAYGWGVFDEGFQGNLKVSDWKAALKAKMQELGVEELGRISHGDVAKLYMKANVWAYPSGFGEIDCISLSKAMAAGAIPVTTDFAALGEKQGHGGFFFSSDRTGEKWNDPNNHDFSIIDPEQIVASANKIIELLKNPPSEEERKEMREWAKKRFAWSSVADIWDNELCG